MDEQMKTTYCPDCEEDVITRYRFLKEWCSVCGEPLTEPIKLNLRFIKEAGKDERHAKMAKEFSVFED